MRKIVQKTMSLILGLLSLSCSDEMHMLFPEGPQGPTGLSAYEVWVESVNKGEVDWPKDRTDVNNFFLFLKGKDGKDGVDGSNGLSAYEIWKQEVAKGLDNPHKPGSLWDKDKTSLQDFWHYLSGADGQDGATPKIGENGNWWINGEDTGIPARGKDGANGADGKDGKDAVAPIVEIGSNGNWFINGVDTGVPARGKDGQNGSDGKDGRTPTITIGENGNWFVDGEDTGQEAQGPKGDKGQDGENGKDGNTPVVSIGQNGNWYINGVDTGKPSRGKDGDRGLSVTVEIGKNGNWFIGDVDTGVPARGTDGQDGTQWCIGENGNWYIYDYETNTWKDSGKPSRGENGIQGPAGTNGTKWKISNDYWYYYDEDKGDWVNSNNPSKGTDGAQGPTGPTGPQGPAGDKGTDGKEWTIVDGYWHYKNPGDSEWTNSGEPSKGADGTGSAGLSAYELWMQEVLKGNIYKNSVQWPKNKTSMSDFWEYLRGNDGKDGENGSDGKDLSGVPQPVVIQGRYNVIAQYYDPSHREYVHWGDGSVVYTVYDNQGNPVGEGVEVSNMPKIKSVKTYTTDSRGQFTVSRDELPTDSYNYIDIYGTPTVKVNGENQSVASATHVPCRMQVRLTVTKANFSAPGVNGYSAVTANMQLQRKTDASSDWENIPTWIGEARGVVYTSRYDAGGNLSKADVKSTNCVSILADCKTSVERKVKSTEHFNFLLNGDGLEEMAWYGKGDDRYFLRFSIKPYNDNGINYGLPVTSEEFVEDVPMIPMPYFTKLDLKYDADNKNIVVKATYCQPCLEGIQHLYDRDLITLQMGGGFKAFVPAEKPNFRNITGMRLYAIYRTSGGQEQTNKSASYSINQLLNDGNPGYASLENIKSGSWLQTFCEATHSYTFFTYNVAELSVEGSGVDAIFSIKPNPAVLLKIEKYVE